MSVSYDRVCRLCLSSKGDLLPIFSCSSSEEKEPPELASKIQACVSIQILADDELPTQVCKRCLDNVNNWHLFKGVCEKTQHRLLKLHKNDTGCDSEEVRIKNEPVTDDDYDEKIHIDGKYPEYEQNADKVGPKGPPILASLGLAPRSSKRHQAVRKYAEEDEDEEDDEEDYGEPVKFAQLPKNVALPEVSVTVMRPSGAIKAQPNIIQLASKDCLVCGKTYQYSHNARRHELSAHRFDRYTNKTKEKQKRPKLMPNPFNPKARLMQHPSKHIQPHNLLRPPHHLLRPLPHKTNLPFPLKIKSLSELQVRQKESHKEPQILKKLLTSRAERHVSEPKLMPSAPESPETVISEPEIASFHVETILTEPDTYGPDDDDEIDQDEEHHSQPAVVEMESDNEMEITAGSEVPEDDKKQESAVQSEEEDNVGDNADEDDQEKSQDEKSQDEKEDEILENGIQQPDNEQEDEHDEADGVSIAPIVEINEGEKAQDEINEGEDDDDAEEEDTPEAEEAPEAEEENLVKEFDPDKTYVTKSQQKFILKYRDIIEQINTKKCHCCNKEYPRRKAVIQHLQKNGHTVPKHTCYNCVVTFGQIGALLSHMRANVCTDLWKVIYKEEGITDDMVTADAPPPVNIKAQYKDILNARSYACTICPVKFQLKQLITKHVQEFHEDGQSLIPLTCIHCGSRFKEHKLWKRHIRNAECTVHIACELCPERFRSIMDFNEHALTVHAGGFIDQSSENQTKCVDDRPTDCPICKKPNSSFQLLVKHLKYFHEEEKPHYCHHCDNKYAELNELYQHLYADHSDKTLAGSQTPDLNIVKEEAEEYHYSCTECNAIFETVDAWTDHQVAEHNQIAHHCDECEKKFLRPSELAEHKSTHLKVKFYSCSVCSNSYGSADKLSTHVMASHPEIASMSNPESQFYCVLCVRSFKSRQAYSNHMRIHSKVPSTNRKPGDQRSAPKQIRHYPQQGGMIPFRQNLSVPNAPYSCDICGKGFMHKKNIWKHKKVLHADIVGSEKPSKYGNYSHEETATQASTEDEYQNMENGMGLSIPQFDSFSFENFNEMMTPQMFKCDQCPKQFPSNGNLMKHKKMKHNPDNPLHNTNGQQGESSGGGRSSCTICKINFADKKAYYRHRKIVHKANIQMCKICSKPLNSTLELYEHLKAAHARELLGYNANQAKETQPSRNHQSDNEEETGGYHAKYPCNGCGKQFIGMLALQNHQCAQDIQRETYDCEICHKSYSTISALKSHRGWHLRSPDGKAAATNTGLWMPQNKVTSKMSKHEILEPPPATRFNQGMPDSLAGAKRRLPPEVEVTVVNPNKKMRSDDSADDGSFRGESSQSNLLGSDDRYCGICDKEFTKRAAYQRHMDEVHQPNSVFCPVCDKSFTRKSTLLIHMRKHYEDEGEAEQSVATTSEVFSCDLCGVQYRSGSALRLHRARHHGEQESDEGEEMQQPMMSSSSSNAAFTCQQCGDGVSSPRDLMAHRNWHATPSKFYCHICKVYFPRALDLSGHTRKRHADNEKVYFPCAMCDRFYMNKKSLQRHIEMSH